MNYVVLYRVSVVTIAIVVPTFIGLAIWSIRFFWQEHVHSRACKQAPALEKTMLSEDDEADFEEITSSLREGRLRQLVRSAVR